MLKGGVVMDVMTLEQAKLHATVYSDSRVVFTFRNSAEISMEI